MATKSKTATIDSGAAKVPGMLAFSRKLEVSDGVMASTSWSDRTSRSTPIIVVDKRLRGTLSSRSNAAEADTTKINFDPKNANPQWVDYAALKAADDTLAVSFTMRVLGKVGVPTGCGSFEFRQNVIKTVEAYKEEFKFHELARRYVINLANGRFLWRNGVGSPNCEVHVQTDHDGVTSVFDAHAFSVFNFEVPLDAQVEIDRLTDLVSQALCDGRSLLLKVTAFVRMGTGQEVFPSQEMIMEKKSGDKSRTLYVVDGAAGMHSQKLSNAIRTIDDWHASAKDVGPIAIEPFGSVTTMAQAFRLPQQKVDFYNLFDNWIVEGEVPTIDQKHYVMAILIRGGVFGAVK